MLRLHPLTAVMLVFVSGSTGAACTAHKYEQKITRITEDREAYLALAQTAMGTSTRSLTFALGYQEVLDTCLQRLYRSPSTLPVVVAKPISLKGGIGGPNTLRGDSRIP
jgi:hypothetical protein